MNQRALKADRLLFTLARPGQVSSASKRLEQVQHGGRPSLSRNDTGHYPAFAAPQYYRLSTPIANPSAAG